MDKSHWGNSLLNVSAAPTVAQEQARNDKQVSHYFDERGKLVKDAVFKVALPPMKRKADSTMVEKNAENIYNFPAQPSFSVFAPGNDVVRSRNQ